MTEERFWSAYVRPALNHEEEDRVAWKVGTSTRAGIPDVCYRDKELVAWLELKRIHEWPARDATPLRLGLSVEQQAHLRQWGQGAGHAYVLLSIERDVKLLPWYTPDVIHRDVLEELDLAGCELKVIGVMLPVLLRSLMSPERGDEARVREAAWFELPEVGS